MFYRSRDFSKLRLNFCINDPRIKALRCSIRRAHFVATTAMKSSMQMGERLVEEHDVSKVLLKSDD